MLGFKLYLAQRISALIMAPLVLIHLGGMIVAVQGGLDAAEMLSRTQGSYLWGGIYGLFVVCVAIHAAIGVRVVVFELWSPGERFLNTLTWVIGISLLFMGSRAVVAVVL